MKKLVGIITSMILVVGIMIQPSFAADYLDLSEYANYTAKDSYASNNAVTYDYIGTLANFGVITKAEKSNYDKGSTAVTVNDAIELLSRLNYIDANGSLDGYTRNVGNKFIRLFDNKITRANFAICLNMYLENSYNNAINSVTIEDITDVSGYAIMAVYTQLFTPLDGIIVG